MKVINDTSKVICVALLAMSMGVESQPLTFGLKNGEGGHQTGRAVDAFEGHMAENGCEVKVLFSDERVGNGAIYFSASPPEKHENKSQSYERLADIRTYQDYPLSTAVLIKASTGITDLKSAAGERLSVVSDVSYIGWEVVQQLYSDAGVTINSDNVYLTEFYEGAITLLLHGDVFAAAVPGPLARRWAKPNGLNIVAESEVLDVGAVWINGSIERSQRAQCRNALLGLKRTTRRDKRMNIFPAWVEGFK